MTTRAIIGDQFRHELTGLLNRFSKENGSDTPDWVLADYLIGCLAAWNASVRERERWYGRTNLERAAELESPPRAGEGGERGE